MIIRGAVYTVLSLFGSLIVGGLLGNAVFNALPGHSILNPAAEHIVLSAVAALVVMLAGSALWGILMGKLAGVSQRRRMALAGAFGFAPITIVLGIALSELEPIAIEQLGASIPIHRLFTLLFVPTAFLITGVGAWAIGWGVDGRSLAWRMGWQAGVAGALAFLFINLLMEALGWQVGGPNAAERFTMLTVMAAGDLAAALAGGGMIGWLLQN
jgi:hypothetical protein